MAETAYDRVTFHGKPLDRATADALRCAEYLLGYELTVVQGIGGATASAGTHTEGRAADLAPYDWENKLRALKRVGFAAWYRPERAGVWGAHIHSVLILGARDNARGIAGSALRQVESYLRGRDGLVGDGPDAQPWRPTPQPVFEWPVKVPAPKRTKVTRARDRLVEAHAALEQAAALLGDVDASRDYARRQRDEIRAAARQIQTVLENMPKR